MRSNIFARSIVSVSAQPLPAAPDPWWDPDRPPPAPGPGNPYEREP